MTKRRKLLLAVLAIGFGLAFSEEGYEVYRQVFGLWWPTYQGKSAHYWRGEMQKRCIIGIRYRGPKERFEPDASCGWFPLLNGDPATLPVLRSLIPDPDEKVLRVTLECLEQLGDKAEEVLPDLRNVQEQRPCVKRTIEIIEFVCHAKSGLRDAGWQLTAKREVNQSGVQYWLIQGNCCGKEFTVTGYRREQAWWRAMAKAKELGLPAKE
jgi:hypothetical protein